MLYQKVNLIAQVSSGQTCGFKEAQRGQRDQHPRLCAFGCWNESRSKEKKIEKKQEGKESTLLKLQLEPSMISQKNI